MDDSGEIIKNIDPLFFETDYYLGDIFAGSQFKELKWNQYFHYFVEIKKDEDMDFFYAMNEWISKS